jgi:hypothetical protein
VKRHVGALAAVGLLVLVAAPASIADPPLLTVPSDMTVAATDASGAVVSFSYTVSDADDPTPAPTATCNPDTGSLFPLGDTTVNCSATSAGGTATRSFKVTVADETPPVLTVPGNQTATTSGSTAVVTYTEPTATDNVDSSPTVSCDHHTGDAFLLGQTTVTCTATDAAGLTDSKSFTVTVSFVDADEGSNGPSWCGRHLCAGAERHRQCRPVADRRVQPGERLVLRGRHHAGILHGHRRSR